MNLKALPFYASLQEAKEASRYGVKPITQANRLLPFQLSKPRDSRPIDCVNVYRANGTLYRTIMGNQLSYEYHQTETTDFITYYGANIAQPLACGKYYLELQGYYTPVFSVVNSTEDLLMLEWRNDTNLTDSEGNVLVLYQTGFMQRLHLESVVHMPVYPYAETGNENEYKEFIPDFKRVSKQSTFDTLPVAPYLADALGALPVHSLVNVGSFQNVKELEITPEWIEFVEAKVTVKFSESTPVIAMGCAVPLELETFDVSSYTPAGYLCGVDDTNPSWQATGTITCETVNGNNTGYTLVQQQDMNPNSPTFNQTRTIRGALNTGMCAVTVTYYSVEQSEYVTKSDCGGGQIGSDVLVKVNAGAFTSTVSQLDANNKALAHLNSIKQATANEQGTCTPVPTYQFVSRISDRYDTPSQACAALSYPGSAYSLDGTYDTGLSIYGDPYGANGVLANGYYRRNTDGKTLYIGGGMPNGVYSCGNDGNEEF